MDCDKKRIVVKVGTSTITHESGKINLKRIDCLARVLSDLMNMGHEIVLVSSGAIGVGAGKLGLAEKPSTTRQKQALAAIGQASLVSIYEKFFKEYGYSTGQVLLTKFVLDAPERYDSARSAFETMIGYGVIPIVNENDVISTYEIEFGDNDTLSAYVANLVDADLLILMSDIDGFYNGNPNSNRAQLIPVIDEITDEIRKCAGGMITKLNAAEIVTQKGTDMVITNGAFPENLYKIVSGENVGTRFMGKR